MHLLRHSFSATPHRSNRRQPLKTDAGRPNILVICVGNPFRGDDGVGLHVARLLRGRLPRSARLMESSGDGADLVEAWRDFEHVFIIDAVVYDGRAPEGGARDGPTEGARPTCGVVRIDAHREPLPANVSSSSTHAFGVAHAVELARALLRLPPRLIVYGIECQDFESGALLTEQAARGAREAVASLIREIQLIGRDPG